jgi:hypothetical protein
VIALEWEEIDLITGFMSALLANEEEFRVAFGVVGRGCHSGDDCKNQGGVRKPSGL